VGGAREMAFLQTLGRYLLALGKRWWALMSCAVFTFIGYYAAANNKGNGWIVGAVGVAAVLMFFIASFLAWKEQYEKASEEIPELEIRWNPGEQTYHYEYPLPLDDPVLNIYFRICIVNISKRTVVTDIKVKLEKLTPHELACVPCCLRLMNDIIPVPGKTPKESFSLNPGDKQFVDLMMQKPNFPKFFIWHTVVPQIGVDVPAQAYTMTISVTAANADPVSQSFELVEDGPVWNLRAVNG
jgi:hypothetical protein